MSRKIGQRLKKTGIDVRIGLLQKTALLGIARILRTVLECVYNKNNNNNIIYLKLARKNSSS